MACIGSNQKKAEGKKMEKNEMKELRSGDLIVNKGSGNAYFVISNKIGRIVAARLVDVSNPGEWDIIKKEKLLTEDRKLS